MDVVGVITDGQLHVDWVYSTLIHNRSTIDGLAQRYVAGLEEIIACASDERLDRYTPSDFPLAELEEAQLDEVLSKVEFE